MDSLLSILFNFIRFMSRHLSRFLHGSHAAVVLFGITLCVIAAFHKKRVSRFLLLLYLAFIFYMTLYRAPGTGHLILTPFWSYKLFFENVGLRMEILNNIWLFIPLGALLGRLYPKDPFIFFMPTLISVMIEFTQFLFDIGYCEFDDVFSNTLGGLIGIAIYYVLSFIRRRRRRKRYIELQQHLAADRDQRESARQEQKES